MIEKLYTEQELKEKFRIELLENNQSHLFKSIDRLDNTLSTFKYWVLALMIAQFGLILTFYFAK